MYSFPAIAGPHGKKSVTWNIDTDSSVPNAVVAASSVESQLSNVTHKARKRSPYSKRLKVPKKKTLCAKLCGYFSHPNGDQFDDDEDDELSYFTKTDFKKKMSEDEILGRLQQAVNELGPGYMHSIETEISKWYKILEREHNAYEETGRAKFKYKIFRKNQYLTLRNYPLYGTSYENHRMQETRLEFFKFGANIDERFGLNSNDVKYKHADLYEKNSYYDSGHWRNDSHTMYAMIALICSASNFIRFPHACYSNGGFVFLITYCLMIALVGQPLLYLEMILGQYSLHGPSGFAKLHPYAEGVPYAIGFVCVVFGTTRSVHLAYCMLYTLLSLIVSPGTCNSWWSSSINCLPYAKLEASEQRLKQEWKIALPLRKDRHEQLNVSAFSTEIYFREIIMDSDWESKQHTKIFHWKLMTAYVIVCGLAYLPIHYNLTGKTMKKWLRYCLLVPIAVLLVSFHQYFFRQNGYLQMPAYFLTVDAEHVSALSVWSEAFEMTLSTLGIGYGFHWSISGRTPLNYRKTYIASWRICGYAMLFALISSLVIFCEVGIVGDLTGDPSHYHVFVERLGISFVCYSGALLKLGGNTALFIFVFFLVFVTFGMWSQIIVQDIILRWIEHGHIIKGKVRHVVERKTSSVLFIMFIQLFIVSPYFFSRGASVLDYENIFSGTLAAYIVVLAELVVAVYLYGFARFLVDLEIMMKTPAPALFQIQIRYIVIPATGILMLPMILNVYAYPNLHSDRNHIGPLFFVGELANVAPILIMIWFPLKKCRYAFDEKSSKIVSPEPYLYKEHISDPKSMQCQTKNNPRFVANIKASSQQSYGSTIWTNSSDLVSCNMTLIYQAQEVVQEQFKKLLKFKIIQSRWLNLVILRFSPKEVRSMRRLIQRIMIQRKYDNNSVDIQFLQNTLEQVVHFTFFSAVRKLQRMPIKELLPFLAEEWIQQTTFHPDDYYDTSESSSESNEGSSESGAESSASSGDSDLDITDAISQDGNERKKYHETHRKLIGRLHKTPEESRILLTIRLKRGLNLPYDGELSVLKFLRRQRAQKERELSCWTMNASLPIDHFIPASVSKDGKKVCFTIFHAVVVADGNHFILHRLPIPRPPIVRVTKRFIHSLPGNDLTEKFSHIVTRRMRRNLGEILVKRDLKKWSKRKLQRHLWRVADRIDDDVYDFLDRILTCVIIILDDSEIDGKKIPKMYLTPRTRRQIPANKIPPVERRYEYEITTFKDLSFRRQQEAKWLKLLEQPSDILYISSDSDEVLLKGNVTSDVKSSSGSSSSLNSAPNSEHISLRTSQTSIPSMNGSGSSQLRGPPRSKYMLVDETLQKRDRKSMAFKTVVKTITSLNDSLWISPYRVRHISARKWSLEHKPKCSSAFTDKEVILHAAIDFQATKNANFSSDISKTTGLNKSIERLNLKQRFSFQSLRNLLGSEYEFGIQEGELVAVQNENRTIQRIEEKLANTSLTLSFFTYGKTMVVSQRNGKSHSSNHFTLAAGRSKHLS